jgi:hypothetical protein
VRSVASAAIYDGRRAIPYAHWLIVASDRPKGDIADRTVTIIERLNRADVEVDEQLFKMALEAPVEAAVWLHDHLDEIEARFAS